MFESKNRDALEAGWLALQAMGRGDLWSHQEAAEVLGIEPGSNRYYQMINALHKRMQRERGISLMNVALIGYQLATPEAQLDYTGRRQRKARRQIKWGMETAEALPAGECTAPQQRARLAIIDKCKEAHRQMGQQIKLLDFLLRPRNADGKRPDPED